MSNRIRIDDLASVVMDELTSYSQEVTDMLKDEVKAVAKETVQEIKSTAPKQTGDYQKGWTSKIQHESDNDIRVTIHNPKEYPLTHLLEHGHAKVNGGRVAAIPHIVPAEEKAAEKLHDRVKVKIQHK